MKEHTDKHNIVFERRQPCTKSQDSSCSQDSEKIKPGLFVIGFFLVDPEGNCVCDPAQCIFNIHDEVIAAT